VPHRLFLTAFCRPFGLSGAESPSFGQTRSIDLAAGSAEVYWVLRLSAKTKVPSSKTTDTSIRSIK
jgi:hypothetical protein